MMKSQNEKAITSVVEAVAYHAKATPEKFCVTDGKVIFNYGEYWKCICFYASYLQSLGIQKGDCVVVKNSQNVQTLVANLAIHLLGCVYVPLEKNIADNRVLEILEFVEAKCYIGPKILPISCAFANSTKVLYYYDKNKETTSFSFPKEQEMSDILFTTGTTGNSKGIMLSHENIRIACENIIDAVAMKEDNVEMIVAPLNHAHGIRRYYANMYCGGGVVILNGVVFVQEILDSIEKYGVTAMTFVPAGMSTFLKLSGESLGNYQNQIRYIQFSAAPIPEPDKEKLKKLLPHSGLYNFYGSSESAASSCLNFNTKTDTRNCIGRSGIHTHIRFFDENGNQMIATKENPGFIGCAGKMNMIGYYKEPELTKKIKKDGYVITQDLGYFDEDGFLYMLGRQGDVIETGGNKVSPAEVEDIGMLCSGIKDCACVAIDNPLLGKEPKLYVVMETGKAFDYHLIYCHMKENLENYKVPKLIEEIQKIPRTYNGKIIRKQLMNL